jgi:hypothetical protein
MTTDTDDIEAIMTFTEEEERSVNDGFGAILTFMEVNERKVIAQRVELEQKEPLDPRPWYEVLESDGNWYRTIIRPGDKERLRQEGKKFRYRSKVSEIREAVANPSIANPPLTILPLELDIIEKIKCSGWYEVDLKGDGVWFRITRRDARIFYEIGDKVRFRNAEEVLVLFPFDPRRKRSLSEQPVYVE